MAETFSNSLITNSIYHLLNFEKYSSFPIQEKLPAAFSSCMANSSGTYSNNHIFKRGIPLWHRIM